MHIYDPPLPPSVERASANPSRELHFLAPFRNFGCNFFVFAALAVACGGQSVTSADEGDDRDEAEPEASGSGGLEAGDDGVVYQDLPIGSQGLPVFIGDEDLGEIVTGETDSTGRQDAYALFVDAASPRAVLSTHLPSYNFGTAFRAVAFSARASRPVRLKVSISPIQPSYWDALESGQAWQGSVVEVGENWIDFSLPFVEMAPLAEGAPQPLGTDEGSAFSIILEESEEVTVWIADIVMVP